MLTNRQFRESAIIRNAQPEPLDDRAEVTGPREWAILACLVLVLLAIAAWAVFGSVERTLQVDGVLVLPGERRAILSGVAGGVSEILVESGDRIDVGQTVVRVVLPDVEWRARAARIRAGLIEEELGTTEGPAPRLTEALSEVRAELAVLEAATEIVSPFAGEITARHVTRGQALSIGTPIADLRLGAGGRLEAVAFVTSEEALVLAAGMAAWVMIELPDRAVAERLEAVVEAVSPRRAALPDWLARLGVASGRGAETPGHVLRLSLRAEPGVELADGVACRIQIAQELTSPLRLLLPPAPRGTGPASVSDDRRTGRL